MLSEWEPGSSLPEDYDCCGVQFTATALPETHTYTAFPAELITPTLGFCGRDTRGSPVAVAGMSMHLTTSGEEHSSEVEALLKRYGLSHWYLCD